MRGKQILLAALTAITLSSCTAPSASTPVQTPTPTPISTPTPDPTPTPTPDPTPTPTTYETDVQHANYYGNRRSDIFHTEWCTYGERMNPDNAVYFATVEDALAAGYRPCYWCHPGRKD